MEGRGGVVEDIHFKNIYANRTLQAMKFVMNYGYRRRARALQEAVDEGTPIFRNIYVTNYTGINVAQAGMGQCCGSDLCILFVVFTCS